MNDTIPWCGEVFCFKLLLWSFSVKEKFNFVSLNISDIIQKLRSDDVDRRQKNS